MINGKTFYKILGISRDAEDGAIRAAYKTIAQQSSPDRHAGGAEFAGETMRQADAAFDVLSDVDKRKQYDLWLDTQAPSLQADKSSQDIKSLETNPESTTDLESAHSKNPVQDYSESMKSFFKKGDWIVVVFLVVVTFASSNFLKDRSISDNEYRIVTGQLSPPVIEPGKYSMSGISIGADISSLSVMGVPPSAREDMGRYVTENYPLSDGNELRVAYARDETKIVYLETHWGGSKSGTTTDLEGFTYGKTTLRDLTDRIGSNGYTHSARTAAHFSEEGTRIMLNSYELEETGAQVVTFVTKIPPERVAYLNENKAGARADKEFKLVAIILADPSYLDEVWGSGKV
ncbi:MAG: J domain-containing protein, partial [Nitrosomonadaceae bacterium]